LIGRAAKSTTNPVTSLSCTALVGHVDGAPLMGDWQLIGAHEEPDQPMHCPMDAPPPRICEGWNMTVGTGAVTTRTSLTFNGDALAVTTQRSDHANPLVGRYTTE
jgi:hypothetical protein